MDLPFKLTIEEINYVLQLLGEQPNKSNTYPMMMKLKQQADAAVITHAEVKTKLIFVSLPCAEIVGAAPVAAPVT